MTRTKNWIFISLVLNRFVKWRKLLHAREISIECSLSLCVPKRDNNSGGSAVPFRTNGISHRPEIIHREIVPRGHRCLLSKIELSRLCSYSTYIYIYIKLLLQTERLSSLLSRLVLSNLAQTIVASRLHREAWKNEFLICKTKTFWSFDLWLKIKRGVNKLGLIHTIYRSH